MGNTPYPLIVLVKTLINIYTHLAYLNSFQTQLQIYKNYMSNNRLTCPIHNSEPLNLLCIDSQCQQKPLVCYLCQIQAHNDHQKIIPLKIFLKQFQTWGESQQMILDVACIDQAILNIEDILSNSRQQFQSYSMIEKAKKDYFLIFRKEVARFGEGIEQLNHLFKKEGSQFINQFNKWYTRHYALYVMKEPSDNLTFFKQFLKNKLESLANMQESLQKILRQKFQDTDVLALFKMEEGGSMKKIHFSQSLMGTCMTIHSPTRASMTISGAQRMMLLQPHLGWNSSVKRWKVKVQKLASWIGVGVAHLDSIKAVNFDFSYTNAGHGNYLISSNGYSWNGYKMQFNSKYQPPSFGTGDVIEVTYDPKQNKVSFKKQNTESGYSLDIDPTQKPIHAAINMSGIGDCVEIL